MKRASGLSVLFLAAACIACATRVGVEFDPQQDFSRYRTWAWLPPAQEAGEARRGDDPELETLVRSRVELELGARGYRRVAQQAPDFYVSYQVEIVREIEIHTETPASQALFSHHDAPSYVVTASERRVRVYEKGTLAVEVAEGRQRHQVWRGVETRRVRWSFEPQVAAVVAEILEHFPPGSQP
jgi:hypothetical protein